MRATIVALLLFPLMATCSKDSSSGAGSRRVPVQGDIFLLMRSGDTKRGSGRMVYLIQRDSVIRDALSRACRRYVESGDSATVRHSQAIRDSFKVLIAHPGRIDDVPRLDIAADSARERVKGDVDVAVRAAVRDSTLSGIDARYRFPSVPAGEYWLYSEWRIADTPNRWLVPIAVEGDSIKVDLSNSNEIGKAFYCGAT